MRSMLLSIMSQTSQETGAIQFWRVQKVMFLSCDWWFSIHNFCLILLLDVLTIVIDGSIKHNRRFGFKVQSSYVIEKWHNNTLQ